MPGPGAYWFGKEEMDAVMKVMESGHLFRYGREDDPLFLHMVASLEKEFAAYTGARFALATCSGTASLVAALAALGLKAGDEVLVPAYTFVASYTAIAFMGLVPVLCEIDDSLTLDPDDLPRRLTPRTRAIMPVHMLGNPCDLERIVAFAREHDLLVIEDCCQAAGATYRSRKVGTIGDIGAFSLNIFKTINSGDGGLVITDNPQYYELAFAMHDQGHRPSRLGVEVGTRQVLGLNFRMNELTAAVAVAQLRKIDRLIATLRAKKARFKELIAGAPGVRFRRLNDPAGECATLCTVIFDSRAQAKHVAKVLGSNTLDASGWHVYSNMEHVLLHLKR
ncbi:MAG TPA: DegT/DnrJ/EryC1/StrS family aminotransferase, partial [Puia sp.]|nr:DegT/DnrJ/EryC1/StrS family aminotransferase [Puia sp.]